MFDFIRLSSEEIAQFASILPRWLFVSMHQWANGRWLTDQSERTLYFCYVIKINVHAYRITRASAE